MLLFQSFVSCVFGIGMVGYAMMCEGLGFAAACLICGPLTSVVSRQVQYVFIFASLILTAVSWLLWVPTPDQFWIVIVMSFIYGLNHGLHRTHLSGRFTAGCCLLSLVTSYIDHVCTMG